MIDETAKIGINAQEGGNETLDPNDWPAFRAQAHLMLDDMLGHIEKIRERPVWQPIPDEVRAQFRGPLPRLGEELAQVHAEFMRAVLPFAVGNVHPGFMGWVHGGGTPVGMVAEMLAAGLNANLGGRNQIPVEVERQVSEWVRDIFGFPKSASGLFVTGTSMANLVAILVARDVALGFEARERGVAASPNRLTAYTSHEVHSSVRKAMDISGLGSDALRLIPTDSRYRIDLTALGKAIERDREAGFTPFLVAGTAGTVNTGAIDDLTGMADLCQREKLWFHVDGAFGALAKLAPDLAARLDGIERADSVAFDFHKWGQAPYDAGFILVRDGEAHKNAFAFPAAYLQRAERGMAAGSPWPCDFGPDLSRGFRALKVWFTLKVLGTERLGTAISRSCALARYLEERIAATPELELMAPVELNIVCFRYRADDSVNEEIVVRLQESGIVAPSTTLLGGRRVIRAAIVNHRTGRAEIDALVENTLTQGRALLSRAPHNEDAQPSQQFPTHAAMKSALAIVDQQLTTQTLTAAQLFQRGNLLEVTGKSMEARQTYVELLTLEPAHKGALNSLGNLLTSAGEIAEARNAYSAAVQSHPDDPMSLVNFANALQKDGETEQARAHFEQALKIDPDYWQAHLGLSAILAGMGDAELAARHRKAAFHGRCVVPMPYRGTGTPITILELVAIGPGNTRIKNFLSDTVFKRYLVATEFYEPTTSLPPHQLIVNAIGDADVAGVALTGAEALLARSTAPVVNTPSAVLGTGRCAIAERLATVAGVVTARTLTLPRESLASANAGRSLSLHGFEFPLLVRTPGFHGGENFLRVETAAELPAALDELPGNDLTVMQFLDASAADGKTRKYRAMMIDGELYPLHAAISHDWKIHYYSAEMADNAEHRAEDAAFLVDMRGVLGDKAMAALAGIQRTLGLDYGGIDFGLNREGEVLLFEANATMAVFAPDADARWDYRRPAVEKILKAIRKMLVERAKWNGRSPAGWLPKTESAEAAQPLT
ncbi:MAG: pyridoxal-dependent decarboxylase [Terracidiphilus sp.]